MELDSLVILKLHDPAERFVGRLLQVSSAGVTIRGLDLGAFEDWMRDTARNEENGIRPSTIFFPLGRIEKIMLDEDLGEIPSLANTFLDRVGTSIDDHLE